MSIVLRAEDAPAESRLEYWRQVLDDHFIPMDIRLDDPHKITDELRIGWCGAVWVAESATSAGEARLTARHIRQADLGMYQLFLQVGGRVVGEQDGRQVVLSPGDLSLADLSRPLRCVHSARRAVFLAFPHALMSLRPKQAARMVGSRIPGDRGAGALLSTLVRQLPQCLDDETDAGAARLGTAVVDLLAATLASRLGHDLSSLAPQAHTRALLMRIHAFIEARLGDPELSPAAIAAAHHISLRYLHKLFEREGLGVAGLIRQRRLECSHRDLLDPAMADLPVSAIALRNGFTSAAHFSRAFRAAYGLPPGEFRVQHNAAVAGT